MGPAGMDDVSCRFGGPTSLHTDITQVISQARLGKRVTESFYSRDFLQTTNRYALYPPPSLESDFTPFRDLPYQLSVYVRAMILNNGFPQISRWRLCK